MHFSSSDSYEKPPPPKKKDKKKKNKKKKTKKPKTPELSLDYQSDDSERSKPKPIVNNPQFTSQNGLSSGKVYSKLSDFAKITSGDKLKKLLMIGLEGTGKSSLLNLLANVDQLDPSDKIGRFRVGESKSAVTTETQFMLAHCLGKKKKKQAMFIDSPGVLGAADMSPAANFESDSDSDEEDQNDKFGRLIAKLTPLREVHLVVVLLPLERGGRLNADVINLVKGLEFMFKRGAGDLFENLVFAFSKCDEQTPSAYEHIKDNRKDEFKTLKQELEKHGVQMEKTAKHPLLFLTGKRVQEEKQGQKKELVKLVKMLKKAKGISTANLTNPRKFFQSNLNNPSQTRETGQPKQK